MLFEMCPKIKLMYDLIFCTKFTAISIKLKPLSAGTEKISKMAIKITC